MNKAELAAQMALGAGISKEAANRALDAMSKAVSGALGKNDTVSIANFGVFSARRRAARQGRDPRTGAKITIPSATVAKFKPGKALKDALR